MDLTSAISGLQQAKTMGSIQIAVAKKIMDSQKAQGNAAIKLVEAATDGFDQASASVVSAANAFGGGVDTYA